MPEKKIRVLIDKAAGWIGHDRGAKIIAAPCAMPAWKSFYTALRRPPK